MKKLIILLTLIYTIFCSYDSCLSCNDESQCHNIKIEFNGFSCFKYESEFRSNECAPCPDNKNEQEAFFNMDLNYLKEIYSSGLYTVDFDKFRIYFPEKKNYDKSETITTKEYSLSPLDKEIMSSKNTCLYQMYGRYVENYNKNHATSYPNVKDKNLCFNSIKFDEALNLIDCGYAEITYHLNGKTYSITTCSPFPNRKMPENVQNIFNKYFIKNQMANMKQIINGQNNKERIEKGEILSQSKGIMSSVKKASDNIDITSEIQTADAGTYEIVIENQYGKKYKYTNDVEAKPIVISEGNKEEEEKNNDNIQRINASNSNYSKINMLFSIFLILFL